ncbi:glycosyltransferase [Gryllotalpicola ginsengisoli]|uniref:glycosyltransferase n=1 Tax=Gryllotalpicola ginsengisoli TaxID=444608 RepID=UPI0003B42F4D|nr:glycosyltransferase [Gryllotalpicola ginsengisoli]
MDIAIAHDYLTQRGGAERVVLTMSDAFPEAPIYTTLHDAAATFPGFAGRDIRPSTLNRAPLLRSNHRLALPFLAADVDRIRIDADVVLASSSGWAHGVRTDGRKIVYCHAPARWLYQTGRYAGGGSVRGLGVRAAVTLLGQQLRRWDQAAARSADRYLVNSTVIRDAVKQVYGVDAEVVPPPPALLPAGVEDEVPGLEPGYLLVVARLLPYKNVDHVIRAVLAHGAQRLVIVGRGPDRARLEAIAGGSPRIVFAGGVSDPQLRWLYRNATALVAAAYEDYGLTPLEAASFGRPVLALRDGGFLDTVVDGVTGVFFEQAHEAPIAAAIGRLSSTDWDAQRIAAHAESFSAERFAARLTEIVTGTRSVQAA